VLVVVLVLSEQPAYAPAWFGGNVWSGNPPPSPGNVTGKPPSLLDVPDEFGPRRTTEEPEAFPEETGPAPVIPRVVASRVTRSDRIRSETETVTPNRQRLFLTKTAVDVSRSFREQAWANPSHVMRIAERSLTAATRARDPLGERKALRDSGAICYLTGEYGRATQFYERALQKDRDLRDLSGEAMTLNSLAAVDRAAGAHRKAVGTYKRSLELFRDVKDPKGEIMALNNLGVAYDSWGRYQDALRSYHQALEKSQGVDELSGLVLENMGTLNRDWGVHEKAVENFNKARDLMVKNNDLEAQARLSSLIAEAYRDKAVYDKAIQNFSEGMEALKRMGMPVNWFQKRIGDIYLDMGDHLRAEPYIQQSGFDSSFARLCLVKGDLGQAKLAYGRMLRNAQQRQLDEEIFAARTGLARIYEASNDLPRAGENYSKALDSVESLRWSLLATERKNFFAGKIEGFGVSDPAKGLVKLHMLQGRASDSFYPSETIRSRSFADNVSRRADGAYFHVPADVLDQEEEIANRVASLQKALRLVPRQTYPERYERISALIAEAQREMKSFVEKLRKDHREYAAIKYPIAGRFEQAALSPQEYVVYFDLLDDGIGVKLVRGRTILSSVYKKLDVKQLEADVQKFLKPFASVRLSRFDPRLAQNLYRTLLADSLAQIPRGTPLRIVPDCFLAQLPFEILVTGGQPTWKKAAWGEYPEGLTYFGDVYPVSYYPSLSAVNLIRTMGKVKQGGDRVLVLADPVFDLKDPRAGKEEQALARGDEPEAVTLMGALDRMPGKDVLFQRLPLTGQLAQEISELYKDQSDIFTGLQASKENLLKNVASRLGEYQTVLFATHGIANNDVPGLMEPVLVMTLVPHGTDGFLTMTDVMSLDMSPGLVALVGCETAVGRHLAGEGVMSMGSAFQYAGAKSVIMSLWSVAEESSVLLMEEFFKGLKAGRTKIEAWSGARRAVRDAGYDHPFLWGAFILVGETD